METEERLVEVLLKSTMAIDSTESIVRFSSVFLSVAEEGDCGVKCDEIAAVTNVARAKIIRVAKNGFLCPPPVAGFLDAKTLLHALIIAWWK